MWIVFAFLLIVSFWQNASGQNVSASEFFIRNSLALDATPADCLAIQTARECNSTLTCWWAIPNTTVNGTNGSTVFVYNVSEGWCDFRQTAIYNGTAGKIEEQAWCFEFFPLPVIMGVFFVGTFLGGYSVMGVSYNMKFWDVQTTVMDTGELAYNTKYHSTCRGTSYLVVLFIVNAMMFLSAAIYWMSDFSNCFYVYAMFMFVAVALVPPFVWLIEWIVELWKRKNLDNLAGFDLEKWTNPTAKWAMHSKSRCQVRCF